MCILIDKGVKVELDKKREAVAYKFFRRKNNKLQSVFYDVKNTRLQRRWLHVTPEPDHSRYENIGWHCFLDKDVAIEYYKKLTEPVYNVRNDYDDMVLYEVKIKNIVATGWWGDFPHQCEQAVASDMMILKEIVVE